MPRHFEQHLGLGGIFGVIDANVFAVAKWEAIIHSPRLCGDRTRRHGNGAYVTRQVSACNDARGLMILGLEHEDDIKARARIFEPLKAR